MAKNDKFANINTGTRADASEAVKNAAAELSSAKPTTPPAPPAPPKPASTGGMQDMSEQKSRISMDAVSSATTDSTLTPEEAAAKAERDARRELLLENKQSIQEEVKDYIPTAQKQDLLKQVSKSSKIVGYVAATEARLEVSVTSKKNEDNVAQVSHKAVHRPPTGRISTIVSMPSKAINLLAHGNYSGDSSEFLTESDLSEKRLFSIPEASLVMQLGALFGGTIKEDEKITETFVKNSRSGPQVFKDNVSSEMFINGAQRIDRETGLPRNTFSAKLTVRNRMFNTVNYIPNRKIETVPLGSLTAEQVESLNMAYFYREAAKCGSIENSHIPGVDGREWGVNAAGVAVTPDGKITSDAFQAGKVTDFFKEVAHWYNRAENGESEILKGEELAIPNKHGRLNEENKITVSTPALTLDATNADKQWKLDLKDYPAIVEASKSASVPLDEEFILEAISEQKRSRASSSGKVSPTKFDNATILGMLELVSASGGEAMINNSPIIIK